MTMHPSGARTLLTDVTSFEIRIGIVAACIPTLRPGYRWLKQGVRSMRSSKKHYKLSDKVRLKPVGEAFPADSVKRQKSTKFGHEVSFDLESGQTDTPEDHIRKSSTVAVDYS